MREGGRMWELWGDARRWANVGALGRCVRQAIGDGVIGPVDGAEIDEIAELLGDRLDRIVGEPQVAQVGELADLARQRAGEVVAAHPQVLQLAEPPELGGDASVESVALRREEERGGGAKRTRQRTARTETLGDVVRFGEIW